MSWTGSEQKLERTYPRYLDDLGRLVAIDSGSYQKAGVNAVAEWVMAQLADLGASVRRQPNEDVGDTFVATFGRDADGPTVPPIGHADTVSNPAPQPASGLCHHGTRPTGPGVSDMKGGLLLGLRALSALRAVRGAPGPWLPVGRLVYVVNPDEEIGVALQRASHRRGWRRGRTRHWSWKRHVPTVPSATARAGMTHLRVRVDGRRAAHAGVEPEKGRSAVLEAAHKTVALHGLNGRWGSAHVNVGRVVGGTRPTSCPTRPLSRRICAPRSVRATIRSQAETEAIGRVEHGPRRQFLRGGLAHHWPMERSARSDHLLAMARAVAAGLGFEPPGNNQRGCLRCQHHGRAGCAHARWAGPGRGPRPLTRRVPPAASVVPRATLLAGLLMAIGREPGLGQEPGLGRDASPDDSARVK